jgi:hypothetical protein
MAFKVVLGTKTALFVSVAFLAAAANAEEVHGYVPDVQFILIQETNHEAQAWAACAAAYDVLAEIYKASEQPAQAQLIANQANGAEVAASMCFMRELLESDDMDRIQREFNHRWNFAKEMMEVLPDTRKTEILADAERLQGEKNGDHIFMKKLTKTLESCAANLDSQQMYIELWREMRKVGWLKLPNE